MKWTSMPASCLVFHSRSAVLLMFVLNAPHRPRSPESTTKRTFFSGRRTRSACSSPWASGSADAAVIDAATDARTSPVFTAYGRIATIRCCARFRRAPATIFIARVIFCVALTLVIRFRMVLSDGMVEPLLVALAERRAEVLERLLQLLLDVLADDLLGP